MSGPIPIDADGWTIHMYAHTASEPIACALLVHAMMADAAYLSTLGDELAQAGIQCWRAELRGHGASRPHADEADWAFDDLVEKDYPAMVRWARSQAEGLPLWLVGHSLGGLTGVAHQARHGHVFDGIIAISSGLWGFERNWLLHWRRRALMTLASVVVRLVGRLPARWWGGGTDEAATYWGQLVHWIRHRCWTALDGFDYRAAAAGIEVPCIGIRGSGDRLVKPSDHAELLRMPQAEFRTVAGHGHMSTARAAADPIIHAIRQHPAT